MNPGYHDFADQSGMMGIPNALDTLSNLAFLLVGILGFAFLLSPSNCMTFRETRERLAYLVFFLGVALTGLGSTYYHLAPGDRRLVFDLVPMTFSFVSLLAATIVERISTRAGLWLLGPLVALGAATVLFWYRGSLHGDGDLKFYLCVQFFTPVLIGTILLLFPSSYTGTADLGIAFGLYVLAKIFESLDGQIYSVGRIVSGHTLKHLTAALACYWILRMLQNRRVLVLETPSVESLAIPGQPDHGAVQMGQS
ncbi:MAG: alkaline phytoceramidase [Bryobacteraceae bacterium]